MSQVARRQRRADGGTRTPNRPISRLVSTDAYRYRPYCTLTCRNLAAHPIASYRDEPSVAAVFQG